MKSIKEHITFSVVIPTYNSSDYIHETLKSIALQTEVPDEIIVVDDFSEDVLLTKEICSSFSDVFDLKFISHDRNLNGAAARNTGIINSNCDYICFMDSDDSWLPSKLAEVKKYLLFNNVDVVYSKLYKGPSYNSIESCSVLPEKGFNDNLNTVDEYIFCYKGLIQTSTLVVRSDLAKKVLFNENFRRHQDYDFVIRLACLGARFGFIDKPLIKWNIEENNELNKGESSDYSLYWLSEMNDYLSRDGRAGFQVFHISIRFLWERRYGDFLFNILKGLFSCSNSFRKYAVKRIFGYIV